MGDHAILHPGHAPRGSMRRVADLSDDEILLAMAASTSARGTCRYLGFSHTPGLRKRIRRLKPDADLTKWAWEPGHKFTRRGRVDPKSMRLALDAIGRAYLCEWCGNPGEWRDKPLGLDIDHIDGDRANNHPDNLRYLCPNCHRQTPTWGNTR